MMRLVGVLALLVALMCFWPLPENLRWRKATILTANGSMLFRDYTIIDSHDPDCRVAVRAIRNPFNLLTTTDGATITGSAATMYLKDAHGHVQRGLVLSYSLMPRPR